jgi:hypothetical protein
MRSFDCIERFLYLTYNTVCHITPLPERPDMGVGIVVMKGPTNQEIKRNIIVINLDLASPLLQVPLIVVQEILFQKIHDVFILDDATHRIYAITPAELLPCFVPNDTPSATPNLEGFFKQIFLSISRSLLPYVVFEAAPSIYKPVFNNGSVWEIPKGGKSYPMIHSGPFSMAMERSPEKLKTLEKYQFEPQEAAITQFIMTHRPILINKSKPLRYRHIFLPKASTCTTQENDLFHQQYRNFDPTDHFIENYYNNDRYEPNKDHLFDWDRSKVIENNSGYNLFQINERSQLLFVLDGDNRRMIAGLFPFYALWRKNLSGQNFGLWHRSTQETTYSNDENHVEHALDSNALSVYYVKTYYQVIKFPNPLQFLARSFRSSMPLNIILEAISPLLYLRQYYVNLSLQIPFSFQQILHEASPNKYLYDEDLLEYKKYDTLEGFHVEKIMKSPKDTPPGDVWKYKHQLNQKKGYHKCLEMFEHLDVESPFHPVWLTTKNPPHNYEGCLEFIQEAEDEADRKSGEEEEYEDDDEDSDYDEELSNRQYEEAMALEYEIYKEEFGGMTEDEYMAQENAKKNTN